jgi:hypothetical protein
MSRQAGKSCYFEKNLPRYEKAHEASNIISAIKATKIIAKLDLRTRRSVSAA